MDRLDSNVQIYKILGAPLGSTSVYLKIHTLLKKKVSFTGSK